MGQWKQRPERLEDAVLSALRMVEGPGPQEGGYTGQDKGAWAWALPEVWAVLCPGLDMQRP